jgi:hypothetical protein
LSGVHAGKTLATRLVTFARRDLRDENDTLLPTDAYTLGQSLFSANGAASLRALGNAEGILHT